MNKKFLLIWTLLLCILTGVSAKDVTIDFTTMGFENGKDLNPNPVVVDGVSVTFDKGTNSNAPKYYTSGNAIRVYGGNTMTVSSSNKITAIKLEFGSGDTTSKEIITDCGTYEEPNWTGSAAAVTFTVNATTGNRRIKAITVTYDENAAVKTPTIEGTTPFIGTTTVTLGCATADAKIFYTLDGSEPTTASTEYTAPFSLDATATVKAIAAKGSDVSSVATKEFVAIPVVADLATLNKLPSGSQFAYSGDAIVVANPDSRYLYIKDATGYSLIYNAPETLNFEVGQHITPNWTGSVSIYNNLFEIVPSSELTAVADVKDEVLYDKATAADVTVDNANKVVVLKGVTYTAPAEGSKNFSITADDTTIAGYNQFGITIEDPTEDDTYEILGVISRYKDNAQFLPIVITRTAKAVSLNVQVATGSDIPEAIETAKAKVEAAGNTINDITVILSNGGHYTANSTIIVPGRFSINCPDGTATIDASANEGAFLALSDTPNEAIKGITGKGDYYNITGKIELNNLDITGVKGNLVYDNNKKYCVENLVINSCTVNLTSSEATNVKSNAIIYFKAGYANTLSVTNSTFWNNGESDAKYFVQYNNSGRADRAGYDFQYIIYKNNTFYNVAKTGQWANYNGFNGQKYSNFTVTDNIFVNCGNKQVARRILGSRGASSYPSGQVTFNNNTYLTYTESEEGVTAEYESVDGVVDPYDVSGTAIEDDPLFKDAASGDFTIGAKTLQAKNQTGAPRWLVKYDDTSSINNAKANEESGAWYTLQGIRTAQPSQKGIFIHNGKKVVLK